MSVGAEDLPKQYDPRGAQERWYKFWLERGYFHADPGSSRPAYSIAIPPPNVTGALHLGHALNNTIQDILIRWQRMRGRDALWMPGTDHAGIATQSVVERRLLAEEGKTRHDLGREELTRRIWAWKEEYEGRILSQLRLMGCSCDWERTRFTLDEVCARAVRVCFFRLFRAGLIFRGKRLVNWDTHLRTAVADDEIHHEEAKDGRLWTIAYPLADDPSIRLPVATTRPETMLGDTAVAVHPEDPRYKDLAGRRVRLPLTDREIPVIADGLLVDPKFGTGCVKVTPAHDPNDYQTGLRHGLPMINLLNPDGTYNENAGRYAGGTIAETRRRVLADLEELGLLLKTEPHPTRVGYSDRSNTPIEPYLSDQWFVRMEDLAERAMEAVRSGEVRFHPARYANTYLDWLGEKRDWCISRQLWWGHRIPIWRATGASESDLERAFGGREDVCWRRGEGGELLICALEDPDASALGPGAELERDPDVLDTWFSSALWPHSTLGWPESTPELAKYYPTSVLSTARDIITLWVARMVIFGQFNTGAAPFRDVYIHPVIQDGKGRRMSKSLGNGVDPVDIVELYGADALRYTLASSATETQDLRMPVEPATLPDGRTVNTSPKFEQGRTFPNKFWNAARFALTNLDGGYGDAEGPLRPRDLPVEDRWILSRLSETARATTGHLEGFRFAEAAQGLRDFVWGEFCDWYLELVKSRLRDPSTRGAARRTLATALDGLCRLLHPIMPFVTEEVWQALGRAAPARGLDEGLVPSAESVCVAPWPEYPESWRDAEAEAVVGRWQEVVGALRTLRAERKVPESAKIRPLLIAGESVAEALRAGAGFVKALTGSEELTIATDPGTARPSDAAAAVLADVEVVLPLEGLIDREAELARQRKALADVDRQLAATRAKLGNESFTSRAPAAVVEQQRAREAELSAQRAAIAGLIEQLGG